MDDTLSNLSEDSESSVHDAEDSDKRIKEKLHHSTVWLDFSMDGLPIHNSGPTQLWPILMRVYDLPQAPIFVVAIFCGKSKPSSAEEFLRQLVTELNELQSDGIIGHNGHDSCLKCTERTRYDHLAHRINFVGIDAPNRTDALFRDGTYRAHIRHSTPLVDLANFDMIMDIPTTDRPTTASWKASNYHRKCLESCEEFST
uniref:Uncharacterized protein n=1 Tax=Anopheles melas TaxID=34690 RepID=A0A182TMA6_9DIPT